MSGFPPPGWRKCDCGSTVCLTLLRDTKKATIGLIPMWGGYALTVKNDPRFTPHDVPLDEALRIAEQWAEDDGGWA